MGVAAIKDTFYLILGFDYNGFYKDVYAFDENLNNWRIAKPLSYSRSQDIAFSLNNKVYFGLDYRWNNVLWELDPSNNYSMTRVTDFPGAITGFAAWFSLDNKGYVLLKDNTFWQYDPILDIWNQKNSFPGQSRELSISFVVNGHAYIGTGASTNNGTTLNDIWEYNPDTNSWTLSTYMPGSRYSAVALTINNKAYIGYGVNGAQLSDFYEFDPNFTGK
jgi:N-acetylneuraminic acid mutarotase